MIELRNIERSYPVGGGEVFVLRRINLDIRKGEFLSVMGRSAREGRRFSVFSDQEIRSAAAELNRRPRRTLAWRTPEEVFNEGVASTA